MKPIPPPPMDRPLLFRANPFGFERFKERVRAERERDAMIDFVRWHFGDDAVEAMKKFAKDNEIPWAR